MNELIKVRNCQFSNQVFDNAELGGRCIGLNSTNELDQTIAYSGGATYI